MVVISVFCVLDSVSDVGVAGTASVVGGAAANGVVHAPVV